jgi:hypothetical protein
VRVRPVARHAALNQTDGNAPPPAPARGRHSLAGDDATLYERAKKLVAVTTERGFALWGALGAIYRGWDKIKRGEVVEELSLIRRGSATYRATGDRVMDALLYQRAYRPSGQGM